MIQTILGANPYRLVVISKKTFNIGVQKTVIFRKNACNKFIVGRSERKGGNTNQVTEYSDECISPSTVD
jgi:hypothetical protein